MLGDHGVAAGQLLGTLQLRACLSEPARGLARICRGARAHEHHPAEAISDEAILGTLRERAFDQALRFAKPFASLGPAVADEVERARVVRLEREDALHRRDRGLGFARFAAQHADVIERLGILGLTAQHRFEFGDATREVAAFGEQARVIISQRARVVGALSALHLDARSLVIPGRFEHAGHLHAPICEARVLLGDAIEGGQRALAVAEPAPRNA